MTLYRKQNPDGSCGPVVKMPQRLENPDGSMTVRSPHGEFSKGELLRAGYYQDTTEVDMENERLTDEVFWDEESGTVSIKTETIPVEELATRLLPKMTMFVQNHLDAVAQSRQYDGILSLVSYTTSKIDRYRREALAGVSWRDDVWQYCEAVLQEVSSGARAIPSEEELLAELPKIVW